MKSQPSEKDLVAAVLIAEAGGEGSKGIEAVYEVIWNRSVAKNLTLEQVVLARKQFSCLNNTTIEKLVNKHKNHAYFGFAKSIANSPPNTVWVKLSNHYFSDSIKPPAWADTNKFVVKIGHHLFYKL